MRPNPRPIGRFLAGTALGACALAAVAGAPHPRPAFSLAPRRAAKGAPGTTIAVVPARTAAVAFPRAEATATLLDEVGHLQRSVPAGEVATWRRALRRSPLSPGQAARLHLWLGETELARDEQPLPAVWHFRMAQRLSGVSAAKSMKGREAEAGEQASQGCAGLAAYDGAVALFYAGDYQGSAGAFHRLLLTGRALPGCDPRRCAGWYRYASACAGYHALRARLGIPEPRRLDPLCGAAGLAACFRALGLPSDRATVGAACRHTGEGSNVDDLLAACKKRGVVGRVVRADDLGLRALPKPLVAHVEGDHFVAVVNATARGVSYLCSDCGAWPGGRVVLTWKQWHALQLRLYVAVTKPGSRVDRALAGLPGGATSWAPPLRLASASLTHLHVWGGAPLQSLIALLKGHVFLIDGTSAPGTRQCGFRRLSPRSLPWRCPPKDASPVRGSASEGDPVNLITGEEEYARSNLIVYNPHGPAVAWGFEYDSLRNPDPIYECDDLGMGFTHPYNLVVSDPSATTSGQVQAGGPLASIAPTGSQAPANGEQWDVLNPSGTIVAYGDPNNPNAANGWSVGIDPADPTRLIISAPAGATPATGYTARCLTGPHSVLFDVDAANGVPQGATATFQQGTVADPPADPIWDVLESGTVVGNSVNPRGWNVTVSAGGAFVVTAPLATAAGTNSYKVRVNTGGSPSSSSAIFSVLASRLSYAPGTKTIVFPNGSTFTVNAPSVPTADPKNQSVPCSITSAAGAPLLVAWIYDGTQSGHYLITFKDGTQWATTGAQKALSPAGALFQLGQVIDPAINNNSTPPVPIPLVFNYDFTIGGIGPSGFPLLTTIVDPSTTPSTTLLSFQRVPGGSGSLKSVTDAYGRSVFYHVGTYANPGVPAGTLWASYQELDGVSVILPSNTQNPPYRWTYGYTAYANGHAGESVNLLSSISVPSPPNPQQLSTATIAYDSVMETVTSLQDANGNVRAYSTPIAGETQVIVTRPGHPELAGFGYTVVYDSATNHLIELHDNVGNVAESLLYEDPANPDKPTHITAGGHMGDSGTLTTTLNWEPPLYPASAPVAYGDLLKVTSPKGTITTYGWDHSMFLMGRLHTIQQGSKPTTTIDYFEPSGLVKDVMAPMPQGPNGNNGFVTTAYTYTNLGNIQTISRPPANNSGNSFVTNFAYPPMAEAIGEPSSVTDSAMEVTQFGFDGRGNIAWIKDPRSNITGYTPDLADETQTITYPATGQNGPGNAFTSIAYLYPGGPVTSVTGYDESGRQFRQTTLGLGPEGELALLNGADYVSYQYRADYHLYTSTQVPNSTSTTYGFNWYGYLTSIQSGFDGDTIQFTSFDKLGRPTSRTDGAGGVTNFGYSDPDGLLTDVMYPGHPAWNVHVDYDAYDRRMDMSDGTGSVTYLFGNQDELIHSISTYYNEVLNKALPSRQIAYTYYPDGSRESMHTMAGQYNYGYDLAGRMNSLQNPYSEVSGWSYLADGLLSTQTLGNSVVTAYTPNQRGFLTSLQTLPPGAGSNSSQFTGMLYDGLGDPTQVNATIPAVPGYGGQTNYQFDSLQQLTQEQSTRMPVYTNNFSYSPEGNPDTFRNVTSSYTEENQVFNNPSFQYNNNDCPYVYPIMGAAQSLFYDYESHLTQVGPNNAPIMTAGYNGDGLRAWKQTSAGRTYFLFDGAQPVVEMNADGTVLQAANTFGANGLLSRNAGGASTFYSFDPQGNVCQRFNSSAQVLSTDMYDAYGAVQRTPSTASDVFGYGAQSGYCTDPETGLLLLTHRYYDPGTGRFVQPDPIGMAGGANLYRFVGNNPLTGADPLGLTAVLQGGGSPFGMLAGAPVGPTTWLGGPAYQGDSDFADWGLPGGLPVTPNGWRKVAVGDAQFAGQVGGYAASQAAALLSTVGDWVFGAPDEPPSGGGGPMTPAQLLKTLPPGVKKAATAAFKDNSLLASMSACDREAAASVYEQIAPITEGGASRTTSLYNLERAKFLRGQVDHIAGTVPEFAKEYGYPVLDRDWP